MLRDYLHFSQLWIDNCELWIKKSWGLTWGLRWGLTWGVTWGLENIKLLIQSSLSEKTGGLGRIEIIRGFIKIKHELTPKTGGLRENQ